MFTASVSVFVPSGGIPARRRFAITASITSGEYSASSSSRTKLSLCVNNLGSLAIATPAFAFAVYLTR